MLYFDIFFSTHISRLVVDGVRKVQVPQNPGQSPAFLGVQNSCPTDLVLTNREQKKTEMVEIFLLKGVYSLHMLGRSPSKNLKVSACLNNQIRSCLGLAESVIAR